MEQTDLGCEQIAVDYAIVHHEKIRDECVGRQGTNLECYARFWKRIVAVPKQTLKYVPAWWAANLVADKIQVGGEWKHEDV